MNHGVTHRQELAAFYILLALFLVIFGFIVQSESKAATNQGGGIVWERDLGRQKLTPTVSTALNVPAGAKHAEFRITGGEVFVRADGGTVNDAATTSTADAATMWDGFPWAEGHHRKEEVDGPKLSAYRFKCASCTVWVWYFGDRRP